PDYAHKSGSFAHSIFELGRIAHGDCHRITEGLSPCKLIGYDERNVNGIVKIFFGDLPLLLEHADHLELRSKGDDTRADRIFVLSVQVLRDLTAYHRHVRTAVDLHHGKISSLVKLQSLDRHILFVDTPNTHVGVRLLGKSLNLRVPADVCEDANAGRHGVFVHEAPGFAVSNQGIRFFNDPFAVRTTIRPRVHVEGVQPQRPETFCARLLDAVHGGEDADQ